MEDKQPNPALVIERQLGLFILNTCFNKTSVTFCYLEFDSCNQNWSVFCGEAAKSDMTNVGQTVQVCSQSGRRDWSPLESIMIKPYWPRTSIKIFIFLDGVAADGRQGEKFQHATTDYKSRRARWCVNVKMVPMATVSLRFSYSTRLEKWCHKCDGLQLIKPVLSLKTRTECDAAKQTCLISRAERKSF